MKHVIKHGAAVEIPSLEEIATLLRETGGSEHVAFGADQIERTAENWPVMGHERKIRATRRSGDDNFAVPAGAATYTDLLDQDFGRGAISLINIGANPCFVYLSSARRAKEQSGKVAAGYLAAGATWDGEIGSFAWVGPVSVRSVLGTILVLAVI